MVKYYLVLFLLQLFVVNIESILELHIKLLKPNKTIIRHCSHLKVSVINAYFENKNLLPLEPRTGERYKQLCSDYFNIVLLLQYIILVNIETNIIYQIIICYFKLCLHILYTG